MCSTNEQMVVVGYPQTHSGAKKGRFCQICKRKTCLKTKRICVRLENYLKKMVDKSFWHGVESYLPSQTFDFMQKILYSPETKEDMDFS
jgi:hypothetical protein